MPTDANETNSFEAKLIRKLQWRLIPFLFFLYVISFIDRSNISIAALTMNKDLAISSEQFGWVAGVFFFGYVLSGIPSNLMLHRFGARLWITVILILWGTLALMMGLVHSVQQLYVLRFVLGLAEGGYFPGVALYLTYWFRQREQAQCIALFLTGLPASNMIGAPLSGWILDHVHWMHWPSWRWLLVVEGAPAIIFGIVTYFILPSRPSEAGFLTSGEKDWVQGEGERERPAKKEAKTRGTLQTRTIFRVWHAGLIVFATNCGGYMLTFWMPQLIKFVSRAISNTVAGLLGMLPPAAGLGAMVVILRSSDKRLERRIHAGIPALFAGAAMAVLGAPHSIAVTVALLGIAVAGMYSVYGPAYSLPSELLTGSAVAAGLGFTRSNAKAGGVFGADWGGGGRTKKRGCVEG